MDYPPIPYGRAHFRGIRLEGCLYVDKTRYLRELERHRYAFLVRPRRFGKTCWLSLLESYYGRDGADAFDAAFAGTEIGKAPTPHRSGHMVLRFDFSAFHHARQALRRNFENYCRIKFRSAVTRHADLFPGAVAKRLCDEPTINDKLTALLEECQTRGVPLYVLIDEYDHFANAILAAEGSDAYHAFTHGGGFYRSFFATLKAGTANGSVDRLFVTGVSPITMDDVTSGFNIGKNLSLLPEFNELLGFTEAEVRQTLETYQDLGALDQDVDEALTVMREWYDGYRFAEEAPNTVFNTDMVLYYLDHSLPNKPVPRRLIDVNVRMDYGKLRHLLLTGRQLNGNFDLLRDAAAESGVDCALAQSFPLSELPKRENFLSLLHYFGLLSIREGAPGGTRLGVPNQTVRQLLYDHLRDAWRDLGAFSPDFVELEGLVRAMAARGEWRPAVERLAALVAQHTGIRDYLQGEKAVQSFLAAYLSMTGSFAVRTEAELGKGYADLVLAPLDTGRHGFVIELKHVSRSAGEEARVPALAERAERQLRGCLADRRLEELRPGAARTGLALVFRGWELAHASAVR